MSQSDCVFCKIIAGTVPATRVFEDDSCLAFLDISPLAEGHLLLIPKAHAATVDQLTSEQAGAMLMNLPSLVAAVQAVTGCDGVNVLQNNGRVAHQLVMHVHFHIIPRRGGDEFHFNWPAKTYTPKRAEALAEEIRCHLR
jgi:histidine triad (HIT) family protein